MRQKNRRSSRKEGEETMTSIGVIGAGTWGTALAVLLHNNGHQVEIWSALPEEIEEMGRTRRHKNLPEAVIPEEISFDR